MAGKKWIYGTSDGNVVRISRWGNFYEITCSCNESWRHQGALRSWSVAFEFAVSDHGSLRQMNKSTDETAGMWR